MRSQEIYEYIYLNGSAKTIELAERFGVSEQTIRKDLVQLDNEGQITRIHGGAVRKQNFKQRMHMNVLEKKFLVKEIASIVSDGDNIFIDSGTTYFHLAELLKERKNLTIVTCSVPIAYQFLMHTDFKVILLGGEVSNNTLETYSSDSLEKLSLYKFDKAFLGISGFSIKNGLTEQYDESHNVKRIILPNSDVKIVVAEGRKKEEVYLLESMTFKDIDYFVSELEDEYIKDVKRINPNLNVLNIQ